MKSTIYLDGVIAKCINPIKYDVYIPHLNENRHCKRGSKCPKLTNGDLVTIEFSIYDMDLNNGKIINSYK